MIEKPIERLNYYNGEQLKARDLLDEQEYHIRVRRWLNKSLFSAGIAHGLEVHYEPGRKDDKGRPLILVTPGLALDADGREMILVEETGVPILGRANPAGEPVQGNYIYIQYYEETRSEESDNCAPRGSGRQGQAAWGGPARVRATPILGWSDVFPHESSGKVVLAQVELDSQDCSVRNIYNYPRRYIGPASNAAVRQYALEGERHIDARNPGRIYFHIRGRQPSEVTLYLREEAFSTLFYTELGQHNHAATLTGTSGSASQPITTQLTQHAHSAGTLAAAGGTSTEHSHDLNAREGYLGASDVPGVPGQSHEGKGEGRAAFFLGERDWMVIAATILPPGVTPFAPEGDNNVQSILPEVNGNISGGDHSHSTTGKTANDAGFSYDHTHSLSTGGNTGSAGVTDSSAAHDYTAHGGAPLIYVDDLQIYIGKVQVDGQRPDPGANNSFTREILTQLQNTEPVIYQNRQKLGEGTGGINDPLYNNGTGPIRLDLLSPQLAFPEGEYYIELRVASGGGRILYNLYVE